MGAACYSMSSSCDILLEIILLGQHILEVFSEFLFSFKEGSVEKKHFRTYKVASEVGDTLLALTTYLNAVVPKPRATDRYWSVDQLVPGRKK